MILSEQSRSVAPRLLRFLAFGIAAAAVGVAYGQGIQAAWIGHGHDSQHSGISAVASQPLHQIIWQKPVDLMPVYNGNNLLIHYGSPLVTKRNTVIFPVKTGQAGGFRIEAHDGSDGTVKWMMNTDYILPSHSWVPSCGPCMTLTHRIYLPGAGGTVYYRDNPDDPSGPTGQIAFYGLANYQANPGPYNSNVRTNTPITSDRDGNIYFGFYVTGPNPSNLVSGLARISSSGEGTWVSASAAAGGDGAITKIVHNCAPAINEDVGMLYVAVSTGPGFGRGYLVALDRGTLAFRNRIRLKDVKNPANDAFLPDDGTASPTIGPDGDVYFGVLENPFGSNHLRGWLRHFDAKLRTSKPSAAFGWDDTASIVPAAAVPSYQGASAYLIFTKYNNYVEGGGDGVNKIAILDPNATMVDPISGATVMNEVLTIAGPTPDLPNRNAQHPNAVREWCINTAAVDPFARAVMVNNEDGKLYCWDLTTNTLEDTVVLTVGIGEAYTPTVIGMDGKTYAINNAILFAVGP